VTSGLNQAHREGEVTYPGPATFGGAHRRSGIQSIQECAILIRKIKIIFSPEGPHENVSPGPDVALDVPGLNV